MDGGKSGRKGGGKAPRRADAPAARRAEKATLTLSLDTSRRLGIEAEMRRTTRSAVAEEVLARHLSRWRLPSIAGPRPADGTDAEAAEAG